VREGELPAVEPSCELRDLFTPAEGEEAVPNIHPRLVEMVSQACADVEENSCVPLALISLPPADQAIMINLNVRPLVINNTLLLELLLCLAERLE
jgi:hypothetical protein